MIYRDFYIERDIIGKQWFAIHVESQSDQFSICHKTTEGVEEQRDEWHEDQ